MYIDKINFNSNIEQDYFYLEYMILFYLSKLFENFHFPLYISFKNYISKYYPEVNFCQILIILYTTVW